MSEGTEDATTGRGAALYSRTVLWAGAALTLVGIAGAAFSAGEARRAAFDMLHWTASFTAAALLALAGLHTAQGSQRRLRLCLSLLLCAYAAGNLVWIGTTLAGFSPFPGPADMLLLAVLPAAYVLYALEIRRHVSLAARFSFTIDVTLVSLTLVPLVLALYLSRRAELPAATLAILALYPVLQLSWAGLAWLAAAYLQARPGSGWLMFTCGLSANALLAMAWNAVVIAGAAHSGSLLNAAISLSVLLMGLGAASYSLGDAGAGSRAEPGATQVLRYFPIIATGIASVGLVLTFLLPGVPLAVRASNSLLAWLVALLAILRQSIILRELRRAQLEAVEVVSRLEEQESLLEEEISIRAEKERELRESQQTYEALFRGAPIAMLVLKGQPGPVRTYAVADGNDLAREAWGSLATPGAVIEAGAGGPAGALADGLATSEARGELVHFEVRNAASGREYFCAAFPIGQGRLICASVDLTESRQNERDRLRLLEELNQSQKLETIGQLAGGVAHEINNMLIPVLVCSETLQAKHEQDPEGLELAQEVARAGSRIKDLCWRLLGLARRGSGHPEHHSVNEVIREMQPMLRMVVRENVVLEYELEPGLPLVYADSLQIHQIILNLATNAMDAMPKGGRIRISTCTIGADRQAEAGKGAGVIELAVEDTGTGMSEEVVRRALEPFYTTKEAGRGTGLGLYTVQKIVAQYGGEVGLESAPGHGATVKIRLPAAAAPIGQMPGAVAPAAAPATGTLLVVEDDPGVLRTIAAILRRSGYEVLEATGGREALALLEDGGAPQLLVSDVIMPGMSGPALYAEFLRRLPGLRVLFLSGYGGRHLDELAETGADFAFLQKPVDTASLLKAVRELLAQ